MKKFIGIFFVLFFSGLSTFAVDFDESIDSEIRQNNNVEESALPALPSYVPTATAEIPEQPTYSPTGKTYTIKKGKKIQLVSVANITDRMPAGTSVSFRAKDGFVTKEGVIIPVGTVFKGKITDSHPPQLTGNGGLIELKINEIYFNGVRSEIETKVSLANSKRIFLSNIKGERTYWENVSKTMKPGMKVFSATQSCATAMSNIPILNLVAFVPMVGGAAIYTVNFVVAPVISIFKKGESIALPSGTVFEIKTTKKTQIKG